MKRMTKFAGSLVFLSLTAAAMPASAAKIGVTMSAFDDNFLTVVRNSMKSHAASQKDVSVQFEDAQNDIGKQLSQMGISTAAVARGKFTTAFPLRAPIAGTVSQITASLGSFADMQTPLMKIQNNQAVECDLNIFEKDLQKVKPGDKVYLSLTNQPGVKLAGHVYGLNQYFNDNSKSVAVHVKIDAQSLKTSGVHGSARLFDGMYVSGKIATGSQSCIALPSKAIVTTDGKQFVFALNGKPKKGEYSFSRHEVITGVSDGAYTEVKLCKHLKQEGKKIVTENAYYLASLTGEHADEH